MNALVSVLTPELALMALIVAAAGVLRGFTGFGAGLVMVPAVSLLIGPAQAVPLVVLLDAAASVQLLPGAVRHVRWRTVAPLGVAAALTIPVGGMLLVALPAEPMKKIIGTVVLIFVVVLASGWRYRRRPTAWVGAATGATSGLLTGMAGIGGPPVILFFLAGPNPAREVRSSLICFLAITQAVAIGVFLVFGLLDLEALWRTVILSPAFLAGALLGSRLFGRVDERVFRGVALTLLALVAIAAFF